VKKTIILSILFFFGNYTNCVFFNATLKDVKKEVQHTEIYEDNFLKNTYKLTITYYKIKINDYSAEVVIDKDERKNYKEIVFLIYKKRTKENPIVKKKNTGLFGFFHSDKIWLNKINCPSVPYVKRLLASAIQKDSPKTLFSSSKLKYKDLIVKTFR